MNPSELIWMNGEFVPWDEAQVHVLTHALHYGTSVFEGVRCYDTELGPAVFRNQDHVDRLYRSSDLYYMPVPFEPEQIRQATLETVARNNLRSCYIRPLVFRGYGTMGLFPLEARVDVIIAVWEWGAYLGEDDIVRVEDRYGRHIQLLAALLEHAAMLQIGECEHDHAGRGLDLANHPLQLTR